MQNIQHYSIDLKKCTVAIKNPVSGKTMGTGVIVTHDGLIITCYHVIGDIHNRIIANKNTDIYFPYSPDFKENAYVLELYSDPSLDIAFLQLNGKRLPNTVEVANLSESIEEGHIFKSFGFRKQHIFPSGIYSPEGKIEGVIWRELIADNISLQDVIQLTSDGIDHGMSGAAVLDTQINSVVGIVSEYLATSSGIDKNLALAIPVQNMVRIYPEIKQKNLGLRIFDFLRKIGIDNKWYKQIDRLYVPPVEYEDIKESLRQNKIVFISGTPAFGKSYTATRLLWEYYMQGYMPRYVRKKSDGELLDIIEKELPIHTVIYFEDPFGALQYEPHRTLETRMGTIIDTIKNSKDTYVIITSTEEVIEEFRKRTVANSAEIFGNLNNRLFISTPSYDYKRRSDMLHQYAAINNCNWINNANLVKYVLDILREDQTKLLTPWQIRDFTIASKNSESEQELLDKINEKSKELVRILAEEIINLSYDKIVFLVFPFLRNYNSIQSTRMHYEELITKMRIKDALDFDSIYYHFKDTGIVYNVDGISLSHQLYHQAMIHILSNKYLIRETKEEVSPMEMMYTILLNLSYGEYAAYVCNCILSNFDVLQKEKIDILRSLANNSNPPWNLAHIIARHYASLPDDIKVILDELAANDNTAESVVGAIIEHFGNLHDIAKKILYRFLKNPKLAKALFFHIARHYASLPDDIKVILDELADNDDTAKGAVLAMKHAYDTSDDLFTHILKIPEGVRDRLMVKFIDKKELFNPLCKTIIYNFDKLPDSRRNDWLIKLAYDDFAAQELAMALSGKYFNYYGGYGLNNFNPPTNLRNDLLIKLADNNKAARRIVYIVAHEYANLPDDVKDILIKLKDNSAVAVDVAEAIIQYFSSLPDNIKSLLSEMAESTDNAQFVGEAIVFNFKKLPSDVRNNILTKLKNNEKAVNTIIELISNDSTGLSDIVKNELQRWVSNNRKRHT